MISASAEKTVPGAAAAWVSAEPLFALSATPSIISSRFHCWPLYRRFVSAGRSTCAKGRDLCGGRGRGGASRSRKGGASRSRKEGSGQPGHRLGIARDRFSYRVQDCAVVP